MAKKVEDLLQYDEFREMRFTLTKEMQDTIIKMLVLQQMLNENEELSYKETKLLQKEKDNLLEHFVKEFQAYNIEKIAIIRAYMSK